MVDQVHQEGRVSCDFGGAPLELTFRLNNLFYQIGRNINGKNCVFVTLNGTMADCVCMVVC